MVIFTVSILDSRWTYNGVHELLLMLEHLAYLNELLKVTNLYKNPVMPVPGSQQLAGRGPSLAAPRAGR